MFGQVYSLPTHDLHDFPLPSLSNMYAWSVKRRCVFILQKLRNTETSSGEKKTVNFKLP